MGTAAQVAVNSETDPSLAHDMCAISGSGQSQRERHSVSCDGDLGERRRHSGSCLGHCLWAVMVHWVGAVMVHWVGVVRYLHQGDEEEEGVSSPPDLLVQEARQEREDPIFGRADGGQGQK